ncbi:MAG: hypothetical protein IPM24_13900 [Bryobacterales bacterium]|nr:hypothetical protein [Bryobacterales bacterium]
MLLLADTWVADASGSRILERLQKHAAIVERQIARSLRMLRREMPPQQNREIEPISSVEPEPPVREEPAPASEIAKTNPISVESSPRRAACTRRRAPRLTPRLEAFLEIRRKMRRAA